MSSYLEGLESLLKRSLLSKSDDDISIHRLVQQVAYMETGEATRRRAFDAVLDLLAEKYPRETDGQPMWKEW